MRGQARRRIVATLATIIFLSSTVLSATEPDAKGSLKIPPAKYATAVRFLEQATLGPTPRDIQNLSKVGFQKWFSEQEKAPISAFPDPPNEDLSFAWQAFLVNAMNGPDQLRQRMALALGEIWVISAFKIPVEGIEPYLRLLQADALGNYRTLMQDVTLSPSMGVYLDMVYNSKGNPANNTKPNENYAREFLQLFTIGTIKLNMDGTPQLDSNNNPIPTYDETTIQTLARVFTGWEFPPTSGQQGPCYYGDYDSPMIASCVVHDSDPKTLFGQNLPGGQTAAQDLQQTLDIVFNHPNVPPFVALRLIQHFTSSNPSPAYVARVAKKFANNGHHARGDLSAVIKAVLLDPEARAGDKNIAQQPMTGGHLREPVLYVMGILRALGAQIDQSQKDYGTWLIYYMNNMGELLLAPPSVFNFYSPLYRIPQTSLGGPEFQILTPSTAIQRVNFVDSVVDMALPHQPPGPLGPGITLNLNQFVNDATNTDTLMTDMDLTFMRGQMPSDLRSNIKSAVDAINDPTERAMTAIYLTASSGLYQVEH